MLSRIFRSILTLALLAGVSFAAHAEISREEFAIKFRRSGYTMIMWHYGPLSKMVKGLMPYDKEVFIRNAETLAFLVRLPKEGFIPGSDKGDTKARPEIWSDAAGFKAANDLLENEVDRLVELAKGNNFDAVKEQLGKVQKACKACHEDFKIKTD